MTTHRESQAQQAKKKAAARSKELAKKEADTLSRKHLAGIRVRQKNLVYITGMRPSTTTEHLSEVLRRDEYFGQYGKIVKIVVSKSKEPHLTYAPVGVYVTYETKEAAARCIQAVDGAPNYDLRLRYESHLPNVFIHHLTKNRAQYGTTKYCSAFLRGDTCPNKGCMFLHEPGDENESFSRQDLSSMNVISTQSPTQANMPYSVHPPQPQPPAQAPSSITATNHASDQKVTSDDNLSHEDTSEVPALPSSANWGNRRDLSRQASQQQNTTTSSSPATASAPESQPHSVTPDKSQSVEEQTPPQEQPTSSRVPPTEKPIRPHRPPSPLTLYKQAMCSDDLKFVFDEGLLDVGGKEIAESLPPLFDPNGAARRRLNRKEAVEQNLRDNDNHVASQALAAIATSDLDDGTVSGSLQLGGEPEDQSLEMRQRQNAIHPPAMENMSSPIFGMEQLSSPTTTAANPTFNAQQQRTLLQSFNSESPNPLSSAHVQTYHSQGTGHGRQASRFSFANDSSASASVNPVANPKLMNQQKTMMPPSHAQQQSNSQYFPSGVQGPPPGLKTTGTPPVSGGGMFGQGHGFATAGLSYGVNAGGRNANDEMLRELLRNRGGSAGSGQASEAGRREYTFPPLPQSSSLPPHSGLLSFPAGSQSGTFQDHGPQKQRKKGKKHRHADTSSGGGVVDLADPSILQARMHQAGATGSQALYGAQGQGQGGFNSIYGNNLGGRAW